MSHLPASGYLSDAARTTAEMKQGLEDVRDAIAASFGNAEMVELTIVSGSVTPTQAAHSIDTEADASSDALTHLDQTDMPDGAMVLIRSEDNARDVIVNHGAGGAGQILLADSLNFGFQNTTQWLLLQRFGTSWSEVLRSYGDQKAAFRTHLGLGSAAEVDTGATNNKIPLAQQPFTDVASATTTDIGAANSLSVRITGTTTITSLGTVEAGIHRNVRFAAALILTHNGTSLILPGVVNITTAANDTAEFISLGSGNWLCLSYKKANGLSITAPVTTYNFTETGDKSIASVVPTGTLWSSSQSIVIPTKGLIQINPYLRIDNASGGSRAYYIGLRIGGTDYWSSLDDNGAPVYRRIVGGVPTAEYRVVKGAGAFDDGLFHALSIEGLGISTGAQTVQPIVASTDATATQTLKGTTVTARLDVIVFDMS